VTRDFISPSTGAPQFSVDTGMPVPPPPSPVRGTIVTDEGIYDLRREGGTGGRIGNPPPSAGALSPEQQQATAWLTDVQAAVKAQLSTYNQNRPGGMKATALPTAQQDQVVQRVTKGRYKTIGELTVATKRVAGTGGAGDSPRDRANRVRQRLESSDPGTIRGSGMPPGLE
jgi:hypothetical protein